MEKIMEIAGGRGSNAKPSGTENPVGWGVKLEKTLRGGGGMDIFWNHTMRVSRRIYTGGIPKEVSVFFLCPHDVQTRLKPRLLPRFKA